jgi:ketosteroid isomerase-like protein
MLALDGLAEAFNEHDLDRIMSYFAEDCSLDLPRGSEPHGTRYQGIDDVRRGIRTRFETTPDVHYAELEHFADDNTGMSKWLLTGTTLAGDKVKVRGCDFYTFQDGKVTRKDSYWKIAG